jgi:hypothetical protein
VNGFTESLRHEVTQRHVRVGLVEPGGVATELGSHNKPEIRNKMIDPFYKQTEVLTPQDIADGITYMVTRPGTPPSASCGSCPPNNSDRIRGPRLPLPLARRMDKPPGRWAPSRLLCAPTRTKAAVVSPRGIGAPRPGQPQDWQHRILPKGFVSERDSNPRARDLRICVAI